MTERERAFADLGLEYAEGIEHGSVVIIPATGREVRKNRRGKWEAQPWNDNWWMEFEGLLDAVRFGTPLSKRKGSPAGARSSEVEGRRGDVR